MAQYNFKSYTTHSPSLSEVASVWKDGLKSCFREVTVEVVPCPDLTLEPYRLSKPGLCGNESVADVGGVPNLVPVAQVNKPPYHIPTLVQTLGYADSALVFGAALGPFHHVGTNSELMPNVGIDRKASTSNTRCAKLDPSRPRGYELFTIKENRDFCLLGNLFISNGSPGDVIHVHVKQRTSKDGSLSCILRQILQDHYKDKQVSIGGVFNIKSGSARVHVMPAFSQTPLETDEAVDGWLKYFTTSEPVTCLSVFHSYDPGQDLRVEHTHCFGSNGGDGGHYHNDTTPDIVEYEGYFMVAKQSHRVDPPAVTHMVGRDMK